MKNIHRSNMKLTLILNLFLLPVILSAQSDSYDMPIEPMQFIPGGNYVIESGSAVDYSKRVQLVLQMDEDGNLTVTRAMRDIGLITPFQVYEYHNTGDADKIPEDWKHWVILFDTYKVFEAEHVETICDDEAAGRTERSGSQLLINQQQDYVLLECQTAGENNVSFPPTIKIGENTYLEPALFVNARSVRLR